MAASTGDWVALLRGVNVGGVTIRSADLREVFDELGFEEVRTVLASGNVAFHASGARTTLKTRIEKALRDRFDYDAWVLVFSRSDLERAADQFPFDAEDGSRQPWLLFCVDDDTRDELLAAAEGMDADRDPVAPGPGVVYWNPRRGTTTDTPFAKIIARRAYKERTTNRNLRTVRKILG